MSAFNSSSSLSIASHPPPEEGGHPQGCNKNLASEDCFDSDFIRPDFQFDPVLQLKGQLGHKLVEYPTYDLPSYSQRPSTLSRRLPVW